MASSIFASPAAAAVSTPFAPLDTPPSRRVRDTEALLDVVDDRLVPARPKTSAPPTPPDAVMLAFTPVPQYRRIFIQGCACSTGASGGGCCPGSVTGLAAQSGAAVHTMHTAAMHTLCAVGAVFGGVGLYMGANVVRNSRDALTNLHNVRRFVQNRVDTEALHATTLASVPMLPKAVAAARTREAAWLTYTRDLDDAIVEQRFNLAVPGALQMLTAFTSFVTAGLHTLGPAACGAAACTSAAATGLLMVYSAALAGKNASAYVAQRLATQPTADATDTSGYNEAVRAHAEARRTTLRRTALAWTALCGTGALAAAVGAGLVVFPGAWAVAFTLAVAAAAHAMWTNRQTRYTPHLPMTAHLERQTLSTRAERRDTWVFLRQQDAALKKAVHALQAPLPRRTRAAYVWEQHTRPQCGPTAFRVLANAVQKQRVPQADTVLIAAARAYCTVERAMLLARFKTQSDALWARTIEMKNAADPCCEGMINTARVALQVGTQSELALSSAAHHLHDDADALETASRQLMALDALNETLCSLAAGPQPAHLWAYARLALLQLSGTLGEALSTAFVRTHSEALSQLPHGPALPVNNVLMLPNMHARLMADLTAELDGAFVHAFFNPRRIEAEMDALLDIELAQAAAPSGVSATAPACDAGTCCK